MFDYPIFEMPFIGQRMLMAINAIIHVFVSHGGAVGGSVVLAAMACGQIRKTIWQLIT